MLNCLALVVSHPIDYVVTPSPNLENVHIEMRFDAIPGQSKVHLQLPSWSPGLYVLENYWKTLDTVSAKSESGESLQVNHDRDTWTVDLGHAKQIIVSYDRPTDQSSQRLGMFSGDADCIHYSGPTMYLYMADRKEAPCNVRFDMPNGWQIATSLHEQTQGFSAANYDELADCPVTLGKFVEETYTVGNKKYTMAFRGPARDQIDRKKTVAMAKFISETETRFFGGAPFERYVWHISATSMMKDGGGGVEHASSTQIFLSTGLGPGAMGGMAHEFFHLWNVKRIRSQVLGPFDYTRLPAAGDLWWLEGVTDYYAFMLPYRAGYGSPQDLLNEIGGEISAVRSNAERFNVSPWDSGYRTPDAVNSMSSGYKVNYYPTGWTLGLLFDIEIRTKSKGRRSLDDVEKGLWSICKGGKAFPNGEIRRQLVKFGGRDLGALYDQWVMKPGELPAEEVLKMAGLKLSMDGKRWKVKADENASGEPKAIRENLLHQEALWAKAEAGY
ncbi:MAG: M61 family metallopeptidase [Armatimonadetes bacterium]|nr:M61 family metallopeptidase [Armatimonadota bacterium]